MFAGKFLSGTLRATLQAVVLLALGFAVAEGGRPVGLRAVDGVFSILVAAAVSAVGLVIGAAARTRDQAIWAAVFFTMFMTIFGGTFFAVSDGPLAVIAQVHYQPLRYRGDGEYSFVGASLSERASGPGDHGRGYGRRPGCGASRCSGRRKGDGSVRVVIRQAMLIAVKDTRIFFKDKFAVGFAFLFPFLFVIGFSLALRGQGPEDEPLQLVLATQEDQRMACKRAARPGVGG